MAMTLISPADKKEINQRIFKDCVARLHSHLLGTTLPATLLCATLVFLGLYRWENHVVMLSWYAAVLGLSVLRIGFWNWYHRDPYHPVLHLKIFIFGTLLSGLVWGIAGCALTSSDALLHKVFIIIIIAGLNAGGCQTLKASRAANTLFMLSSILPLALWTFLQDQPIYTYLSLALFGYLGFMLSLAHKTYFQFVKSLRLRYENELLLKRLKETNKELHQEIIEHEKSKKQLSYLVSHDFLTGVENRYSFDVRFEKVLIEAKQQQTRFCIMFIDIDHFKTINDNYGHDVGDDLMVKVANLLKENLHPGESLARVGGDEFIILLLAKDLNRRVEEFNHEIHKAFARPLRAGEHAIGISLSIGASFFPDDGTNQKILLKKADIALYRAKMLGRNRYEFYQDELKVLE